MKKIQTILIGNTLSIHHNICFLQDVRDFEKCVLYYLHGTVVSQPITRSHSVSVSTSGHTVSRDQAITIA